MAFLETVHQKKTKEKNKQTQKKDKEENMLT